MISPYINPASKYFKKSSLSGLTGQSRTLLKRLDSVLRLDRGIKSGNDRVHIYTCQVINSVSLLFYSHELCIRDAVQKIRHGLAQGRLIQRFKGDQHHVLCIVEDGV